MTSLKQIEANRRNALKSTGPRTPEGKKRSRRNARRHGLTSETLIAALEDAEDYQAFEAAVIADYDVETVVERELVLRLASVLWRLRRATGIESALFDSVTAKLDSVELRYSGPPLVAGGDLSSLKQIIRETALNSEPAARSEPGPNDQKDIGDCFLRLTALPTFPLDRLSRYEYLLWRQARQIVITLESLRFGARPGSRSSFPFSNHTNRK